MAGYIISVLGGKGGVGKSQVSTNLSFCFAAEIRNKVLLLDFDQKASGDQNFLTGLKSKKTIKDLSEFSGTLDARSIQQFIAMHPQNVSYIGMPTDPMESENINVEKLPIRLNTAILVIKLFWSFT